MSGNGARGPIYDYVEYFRIHATDLFRCRSFHVGLLQIHESQLILSVRNDYMHSSQDDIGDLVGD